MKENAYLVALKNVLAELRHVCSDVRYSFFFTKEGTVVTGDPPVLGQKTEEAVKSFQSMLEKAISVGGIDSLLVDGSDGKLIVSTEGDMYLGIVTSKNVDMKYLHLVVHTTVPAIFKLLNEITSVPLTETKQKVEVKTRREEDIDSQDLLVDSLDGLFAEDVQIDGEILEKWSNLFEEGEIVEVGISASGKKTICRVEETKNPALRGKEIIKLPKKIRKLLKVEKGDFVNVIPITAYKGGSFLVNKKVADHYREDLE